MDSANVHLTVFGQTRDLTFPVRVDSCTAESLLAPARTLSAAISAAALADAAERGERPSCAAGCAACCRHLIPVSSVEAVALAAVVAALPGPRRDSIRARFAAAVQAMEAARLLDPGDARGRSALQSSALPGRAAWEDVSRRYFAARIDCPFLDQGRCGIYDDRPLVCREYYVTTPPALCDALDPAVRSVPRPIRMSEALADAAAEAIGVSAASVPLPLALEWAEEHAAELDAERPGEELFWSLVRQLDEESQTPFELRGAAADEAPRRPG